MDRLHFFFNYIQLFLDEFKLHASVQMHAPCKYHHHSAGLTSFSPQTNKITQQFKRHFIYSIQSLIWEIPMKPYFYSYFG